MNFRFPQFSYIPIETVVNNISNEGIQLLKDMLQWNPAKRPTATQSLKYVYFQNVNLTAVPASEKVTNIKTAPTLSEHKKSTSVYKSNTKTMPGYIGSPNVDNHSIQQLQLQIGSNGLNNGAGDKSGFSMKDQYLSRSRYIAGQNTKPLYKTTAG